VVDSRSGRIWIASWLLDEIWGFPLTIRGITAGDTGDTALERAESAAWQGSVLADYTAG
jgi:hypothetical protein